MDLTAVVVTGDPSRLPLLRRCIGSLNNEADSLVLVAPDHDTAKEAMGESPVPVVAAVPHHRLNLSEARNVGANVADGDAVAFLDDDVTVADGWADSLRESLEDGAEGAGGPAVPHWESKRPAHLPERWDWLVGCGPYYDERREVRNTYGCNIAFRADVFDALGGFDESLGLGTGTHGEETDLCERMSGRFEYSPGAKVRHYVPDNKASRRSMLVRSWVQGRTKARIGTADEESGFLRRAVGPDAPLTTAACTASVLGGYAVGSVFQA